MNTALRANPFVGLRPFERTDSLYYFGRDEQVRALLGKLHQSRFLAVVGSSGCGKSSLVRAGLIPALEAGFLVQERDRWRIAACKPGEAPLLHLAETLLEAAGRPGDRDAASDLENRLLEQGPEAAIEALAPGPEEAIDAPQTNILLLVDQFEELFRFGLNGASRAARAESESFVALLLRLAEQGRLPVYCAITMRSDFIGDCDAYTGLPEAINRGQFLVPRLTRAQRREAIVGPVRLTGQHISARLVDRLLNERLDTRDDLPILQHVLLRCWDHWTADGAAVTDPGPIDIASYEAAGTIHDALNRHADQALAELDESDRTLVRHLLQALTEVDARNRRIRRPAPLSSLAELTGADVERLRRVMEPLRTEGRNFLVLSHDPDPVVDISHESLIRQWRTLRDWVDQEARDVKIYRRLADTAARHTAEQPRFYRDADLKEAVDWKWRRHPTSAWAERYGTGFAEAMAFLRDSRLLHNRERRERRRDLAESEKRRLLEVRQRLLTRFSVVVTVIALAAVALGVTAVTLYYQAEAERGIAEAQRELALQQRREAETQSERLAQEIQETRRLVDELRLQTQAAATATSPDGTLVAGTTRDGRLTLLSLESGRAIPLPPGCGGERPDLVVFSPRGGLIAAASGGEVWVMDSNGTPCQHLQDHEARVRRVAFSPDDRLLATGGDDGTCRIWDTQSSTLLKTLRATSSPLVDVAFDPSGERMIAKGADGTVIEWLSPSGEFRDDVERHQLVAAVEARPIIYVHFRSEGDRLAALAWQGLLRADGASVPGIELVGERSPSRSELRYFHRDDEQQAARVLDQIRRGGATVQLTYTPGYEVRPLQFEVWFADDAIGYWFPVVASVYDREQAFTAAERIQDQVVERYDVQVFAASDAKGQAVYAVTLGGYMTEKEARARVAAARTAIDPGAYAWESRVWGENLRAMGAGG